MILVPLRVRGLSLLGPATQSEVHDLGHDLVVFFRVDRGPLIDRLAPLLNDLVHDGHIVGQYLQATP